MVTKSQKELEQPAKGYELEAVAKELREFRAEVSDQLREISNHTKGIATTAYVDEKIKEHACEADVDGKIKKSEEDIKQFIKLKYGTTIDLYNVVIKLFAGAIICGLVAMVFSWLKAGIQ